MTFNDYGNSNDSTQSPLQEFGKYITGFLIVSGIALPLTFYHCGLIELGATIMSIIGGLIVYSDIIIFIWFFNTEEEEHDDFNF